VGRAGCRDEDRSVGQVPIASLGAITPLKGETEDFKLKKLKAASTRTVHFRDLGGEKEKGKGFSHNTTRKGGGNLRE